MLGVGYNINVRKAEFKARRAWGAAAAGTLAARYRTNHQPVVVTESQQGDMRLFSKLVDRVRTLAGVRKVRQIPTGMDKPPLGTSVVRANLRIRLKYPIDDDFWQWLSSNGWRARQQRNSRRRYIVVAEKTLVKLMKADLDLRNQIHDKMVNAGPPDAARSAHVR